MQQVEGPSGYSNVGVRQVQHLHQVLCQQPTYFLLFILGHQVVLHHDLKEDLEDLGDETGRVVLVVADAGVTLHVELHGDGVGGGVEEGGEELLRKGRVGGEEDFHEELEEVHLVDQHVQVSLLLLPLGLSLHVLLHAAQQLQHVLFLDLSGEEDLDQRLELGVFF